MWQKFLEQVGVAAGPSLRVVSREQTVRLVVGPVWLFVTPWTVAPPGSSVQGLLQARMLEWVTMPSSRRFFQPRDRTHASYVSHITSGFFTIWGTEKPYIIVPKKHVLEGVHSVCTFIHFFLLLTRAGHLQSLRSTLEPKITSLPGASDFKYALSWLRITQGFRGIETELDHQYDTGAWWKTCPMR